MDAINALQDNGEGGGEGNEFSPFKSGTTYTVRVLSTQDVVNAYVYGNYQNPKIHSFAAETPSKKSKKGYPVAEYTPFDLAWKYHKDLSEDFQDEHGKAASIYRPSSRFAMRFYDLDSGQPVIIDVSHNQAQSIYGVILKNEAKLDKKAFEIEKAGTSRSTTVTASPIDLDDLTEEQRKNFDEAPAADELPSFADVFVTKTRDEQVDILREVGFDVSLIGLDASGTGEAPAADEEAEDPTDQF
ncbi:hypothetical protein [Salibacterium aidingense]|uniref:hypothetical protein n=1 Tax=Salibacterium aidingense TaxID=384933 RepID=UPI003BC92B9C